MAKHPRNIQKVIRQVASLPVGSRFRTGTIAYAERVNLPPQEVNKTLRWQPVLIGHKVENNLMEWEKTRDYTPEEAEAV